MKAAEMEQIHTELTRHNAELQAELDHKSGKSDILSPVETVRVLIINLN